MNQFTTQRASGPFVSLASDRASVRASVDASDASSMRASIGVAGPARAS